MAHDEEMRFPISILIQQITNSSVTSPEQQQQATAQTTSFLYIDPCM